MELPDFTFADHRQPPPPAACASCGGLQETTAEGVQCMRCLFALALGSEETELAEDFAWHFGDFETSRREDGSLWELGRGAMGVTYRAQDTLLDRPVALKVVRASVPDQTGNRTRFLHEARRAAALRHPNVASIHQYGVREADGQPFYAMELVEGETLEERVRRTGSLPAALALEIGLQIARALQAAEERGIIHRDLKPANVMLVHGHEGGMGVFVKVIDFGLAQVASAVADTGRGQALESKPPSFAGTPAYASPEQLAGNIALDSRTDFYALGATLWFLVSGRSLYGQFAFAEIASQQTSGPLPFERLTGAPGEKRILAGLLGRLLEPDRSRRPQNGGELVALLQRSQQALARRKAWRRWVGWALPAAAIVALTLALGWRFARGQQWAQPTAVGAPLAVAVLPFDYPPEDSADSFLSGGLQREVAGSLARYPGLRVVSPHGANLDPIGKSDQKAAREIGAKLGVAYVVAGSIRRDDGAERLRVQIDLVDARTGTRIGSETYDRSSADLFALRDEIAVAVVGHLKSAGGATLESLAIQAAHAPEPVAYEMYLRAWAESDPAIEENEAQFRRTLHWLHEATARDPQFARAHADTALWEAVIYLHGYDHSAAQIERVRAAADLATSLGPDAAESYDAQGFYQYYIRRDYARAHQEFAAALRVMSSDARALLGLGLTERRQGNWNDALEHFRQAGTLDPLNIDLARKVAQTLAGLGRYNEIEAEAERWRRKDPHGTVLQANFLLFRSRGAVDTSLLHEAADLFKNSAERGSFELYLRYTAAMLERNPTEALRVSRQLAGPISLELSGQLWPRELLEARAFLLLGDGEAARRNLLQARTTLVQAIQKDPDHIANEMVLAWIDALLGQREEAVRRGRAALGQRPPNRDGYEGVFLDEQFATVLSLVGDRQGAIGLLQELSRYANGVCRRDLCLDPDWDTLRGDARFEALRLSLAPKP